MNLKKWMALWLTAVMLMMPSAMGAVESKMETPVKIAIPGRDGDVINYTLALMMLGAQPVVVWDEWSVSDFDGLLLPGGGDIDPSRYNQENQACGDIDPALDEVQFEIAQAFIQAGKPVLGICRGHQLLNVCFGGSLVQDIENAGHHRRIESKDNVHETTSVAGSCLEALYGLQFSVNSAHHQAIDDLGEVLVVIQKSDDGVIEAVVHETLPIIGVQWHPERMCFDYQRKDTVDGSLLIQHFLDICASQRG